MIVDVSNYLIDALNVIVVSNVFHIELLIYEGKDKAVLQKRLFLSCLFSKLPIKNPCVVYIPHRDFYLLRVVLQLACRATTRATTEWLQSYYLLVVFQGYSADGGLRYVC